jgi:hypothetical protein
VMVLLINTLLLVVMMLLLLLLTQGRGVQQEGDAKLSLMLMGRRAWPVAHRQRCKKRP